MSLALALSLSLVAAPQDTALRHAPPELDPEARLTLTAAWEPCRRSKYGLFERTEVLRAPRPAEERRTYGAELLAPFLPPEPVAVGDTWELPRDAALPFLRQLHASARAELHHGFGAAEGAFACLRAASPERLEILFRAHAEFELDGGVTFTPAQFEGRLLLQRAPGRPLALRLALPDRDTNVDVNVPLETQPEGLPEGFPPAAVADIGHVPRMEVASAALESGEWTESIPDEAARLALARRFYALARIDWLPFEEALARARELERPLHVVVLFGTLDDESC